MFNFKKENKDLEKQGKILKQVTEEIFTETERYRFDGELTLTKKEIVDYKKRLHTNGLEKFNGPSYVAGVSFFRTSADKEKENAAGALVFYIEGEQAFDILRILGHKAEDDESQEKIAQQCAQFCKRLAEKFKTQLTSAGFSDLVMSEPIFGRNQLPGGLAFSLDQYTMMELAGNIQKSKRVVLNLTLTTIGK